MRRIAGPLIGGVWIVSAATAFGYLLGPLLRPATRPAGAAQVTAAGHPLAPVDFLDTPSGRIRFKAGQIATLVNVWSPDCGCSRFMEPHVQDLMEKFRPQGVEFVTLIETEPSAQAIARGQKIWIDRGGQGATLPDTGKVARSFGVWAAPAAVIIDRDGRIRYCGSYNVGRSCGNEETAYAQKALEALVSGKEPKVTDLPFYGCQVRGRGQ